jgi:Asp/Glu/hydantoin racemase
MPRIALIHTSPSMIPVFKTLVQEMLAGVDLFNVVDESLLCDIIREGTCPPKTARRLVGQVLSAADAGATHVLVTCSSMGHAVDAARELCPAVVLRVDEPMAREAVRRGSTIGVIATLPSTLNPTAELIRSIATADGKPVQILTRVVDGAFAAVIGGRGAEHDELVTAALKEMTSQADVIVLAQASMARVVDSLPSGDRSKPILSSPRLAVEHLAKLLQR